MNKEIFFDIEKINNLSFDDLEGRVERIYKSQFVLLNNEEWDYLISKLNQNGFNGYQAHRNFDTVLIDNIIFKREIVNYLLTDFTTERWKGIDLESVERQINFINTYKIDSLFGELGTPDRFDVSILNISHSIKNLTLIDGKVYGDVKFLDTPNGRLGKTNVEIHNYKFGIRSTGTSNNDEIIIKRIFTWDIIEG